MKPILKSTFRGVALFAAVVLYVLFLMATLAFFGPAHAAEVLAYDSPEAGIMLHDKACMNADLEDALKVSVPNGNPQYADIDYKNWRMVISGCWVFDGDTKIILADEMGNAGFILRSDFKTVHAF